MAITITKADIKRKCMISASDTAYDNDIDALISDMQPGIEYTIASAYLNDAGNTRLQAVLKLGIMEILSGEFLQQLSREAGASGTVAIGGITVGSNADQGMKLIQQGTARIQPFRKPIDGLSDKMPIASTTSSVDRTFTTDSMRCW
ncbi:MAG: hypothetical protein PHI12_14685 [Dehalococcoidales bacterium]|nr:hypothetical protein [Dehalococcoidales bacterium]